MKKNLSSQSMDAALQDFLGSKPSMETGKDCRNRTGTGG